MDRSEDTRRHAVQSVGWPFTILLLLAALGGRLADGALLLMLVLTHEAAHMAVAYGFGYKIFNLRLLPWGGTLTLGPESGIVPSAEALIALAGPLHHFILLMLAAAVPSFREVLGSHWSFFVRANFSLMIFNLLPIYPLDGARVCHALLEIRYGTTTAIKGTKRIGSVFRPLLILCGFWVLFSGHGPLLLLCSLYLAFTRQQTKKYYLYGLMQLAQAKRSTAKSGKPVNAEYYAVMEDTKIWNGMLAARTKKFIIFAVLNDAGSIAKVVTEEEAISVLLQNGFLTPFRYFLGPTGGAGQIPALSKTLKGLEMRQSIANPPCASKDCGGGRSKHRTI